MANIEFFTGFDGMGTTADMYAFFENRGTIDNTYNAFLDTTNGYNDSHCLQLKATLTRDAPWIEKEVIAGKVKTIGFHCKIPDSNIYASTLVTIRFSSGRNYYVKAPAGGEGISIYEHSTKLADSGGIGVPGTLSHLEIKMHSDSVNGYFGVKLNGILIIDYYGPTNGSDVIAFRLHGLNCVDLKVYNSYFDNLFIADDWVGECRAVVKRPSQDIISEFEPSNVSAFNYTMVNDAGGHDADETYNETEDSAIDLFEFEDFDQDVSIKAVSLVGVARKTDVSEYPVMFRFLAHDGDVSWDSSGAVDSSGSGDSSLSSEEYNELIEEMYYGNEYALDTVYPQALNSGYFQCFSQTPNGEEWTKEVFENYLWGYWGRVPVLSTTNFDGKVKLIRDLNFDGKAEVTDGT